MVRGMHAIASNGLSQVQLPVCARMWWGQPGIVPQVVWRLQPLRWLHRRKFFTAMWVLSAQGPTVMAAAAAAVHLPSTLAECACLVLNTAEPLMKTALSHRIWEAHLTEALPVGAATPPDKPSRPDIPQVMAYISTQSREFVDSFSL